MAGPGRPFQKGRSGNPGGRKKADHAVTKLAKQHCASMIKLLVDIANDDSHAINSRVKAAEVVLNRGLGMPRQAVELSAPEGEDLSLRIEFISAEQTLEQPDDEPPAELDEVRAQHAAKRKST